MEHSSRHLKFKLQSLARRLDDLEEATKNLQKAEDEVLDLQDKIIQAEGSNSSMLADVEALRKRVLKIEGKDEEVRKAEDLCRLIKEKLENEENLTRELRSEIEQLQKKMTELEKLEEAFNKSKNDCTQLCLSLNEEKNMSKKLSSELETLRAKVKELECSESKLDKAEQFITGELEKIKSLTISFVNEKKCFLEKEKQNEKLILDLKQQLELKGKITTGDQARTQSNMLERSSGHTIERNSFRIEDGLTSKSTNTVGSDYIKQPENQTSSKNENEKNKNQEDNKIRDLNQEIEKLRNQIKNSEGVEDELKQLKEKNCKLQEDYISEQVKSKQLTVEIQALKKQANQYHSLENGVLDTDDITPHGRLRNERKYKPISSEPQTSKNGSRDLSPQQSRTERHLTKDYQNSDSHYKKTLSGSSSNSRKSGKPTLLETSLSSVRKDDHVPLSSRVYGTKEYGTANEIKKSKDQPSVLSRYPPAAQEHTTKKSWKSSTSKHQNSFGEDYSVKVTQAVITSRKEVSTEEQMIRDAPPYFNSENKVNLNLHEEVQLLENCPLSSTLCTKTYSELEAVPVITEVQEDMPKTILNSDEYVAENTPPDKSIKNSRFSGRDEFTNYSFSEEAKSSNYNKDNIPVGQQELNSQKSYHNQERVRLKSSIKPQIPEKPHIPETDHKELDKRHIAHGIHSRKQASPKEKTNFQDRTQNVENDNQISQRVFVCETKRVSSDGLESTETQSHAGIRSRTYSPREALQSTVIVKPVIIEKDMKEIMSDYRVRSSSDISRSQANATPSKVSSSITFFPSDAVSSRMNTDVMPRERHTSTSNIRLSANDQTVLKNNISIPFEISIKKEDMVLKVAIDDDDDDDDESDLNLEEINKVSDLTISQQQKKINEHNLEMETVSWKKHSIVDTNYFESKRGFTRSTLRKGVLGSTEELDILTTEKEDSRETKYRRKSVLDEEKPVRLRHDGYSRNKTSNLYSWSSLDPVSKRSQSSLTATEIIGRRTPSTETFSSGLNTRNRYSIEDGDMLRSRRRKYEIGTAAKSAAFEEHGRGANTAAGTLAELEIPKTEGLVEK
ncbi:Hypothetical predicted protein [Pelobates cultripes]|uniref:Leucine zipper protein 1 n=1 Tax=Pelobates cultripes TaxID=61616 RepID=A0AAD1R265_PELCU|nr:Hypothetical predicted protein [Pelobates cultripes]